MRMAFPALFMLALMFMDCGRGVLLSRFQESRKISIPIGTDDASVGVAFSPPMTIQAPLEFYFHEKEIYLSDRLNKKVKKFSFDGKNHLVFSTPFPFSPGKIVIDKQNECYAQNILPESELFPTPAFEICKFDSDGIYMKKMGPFQGCLESLSINSHDDLLLISFDNDNRRSVIRLINDIPVSTAILTDFPDTSRSNMKAFLKSVFPVHDGKDLLLEFEYFSEKEKSGPSLTAYYAFDVISMKMKGLVKEKDLGSSSLASVDMSGNMYFFKYLKKYKLEVISQNMDYDLAVRKRWAVPFKTRDGYLLNTLIDPQGHFYQIRATKKEFSIILFR